MSLQFFPLPTVTSTGGRGWVLGLVVVAAATLQPAWGLSYFNVEHNAWRASHIAVVTPVDAERGHFQVLDSLRGNYPDEALVLPELAGRTAFAIDDVPSHRNPTNLDRMSGERLLVFLSLTRSSGDGEPAWQPAGGGDIRLSTVWLEDDFGFSYRHLRRDTYELFYLRMNEFMIAERIQTICHIRDELARLATVTAPRERAEGLLALLPTEHNEALDTICAALVACGPAAEEPILGALADERFTSVSLNLLDTLGETGTAVSAAALTERIASHYQHWRRVLPDLPEDWWTNRELPYPLRKDLRERNDTLVRMLEVLEDLDHRPAYDTVLVLRQFWQSTPHLDNPRFAEVIERCDRILQRLDGVDDIDPARSAGSPDPATPGHRTSR